MRREKINGVGNVIMAYLSH